MTQTLKKTTNIKTHDGFAIKNLLDLEHHVFDKINLKINNKGIFSCDVNNDKTTMIDFKLYRKNFHVFNLEKDSKSNLEIEKAFSIQSANLPKLTKSIKRKDNLALFSYHNKDDSFSIKVKDKKSERNNVNDIPIHDYEPTEYSPPDKYDDNLPTVTINSSDFQKMCKSVNGIDKNVFIKAQSHAIFFEVSSPTIGRHAESFGKWRKNEEIIYTMSLPTKVLINISKCSSLSHNKTLRIYAKPNLPLRISTEVGGLGDLNIYLNPPPQTESSK